MTTQGFYELVIISGIVMLVIAGIGFTNIDSNIWIIISFIAMMMSLHYVYERERRRIREGFL